MRATGAVLAVVLAVALLAGCLHRVAQPGVVPTLAPGDHQVSVRSGGAVRVAYVHVPAGLPTPAPLLLMLHGGGGNAHQFESSSGMDAVADAHGFIVVYAEGTAGRGTPSVRTWDAMACCGRAYDDQVDDVAFLGTLLETLHAAWPIDATRTAVAGHSNGAMMAYRLAAERSDLVGAAMIVSGAIGGQVDPTASLRVIPRPSAPVSILVLHATDDDHVPYNGGHGAAALDGPRIDTSVAQATAFWTEADGTTGNASVPRADGVPERLWDGGDRGAVVELLTTHGGHGWPGHGSTAFLAAPVVPDASEEIGRFLLDHPRASTGNP